MSSKLENATVVKDRRVLAWEKHEEHEDRHTNNERFSATDQLNLKDESKNKDETPPWYSEIGLTSLICLMGIGIVEGSEMTMIGATMRGLEMELGFGAAEMSYQGFFGVAFFAISCPIWGAVADRYSRKKLMLYACAMWTVCLFIMSTCSSPWQFYTMRAANGVAHGCMMPIVHIFFLT